MNGQKEPVYKRPKFYAVQHVTSVFTYDMSATDDVTVCGPKNLQLSSYGLQKDGKNVGCMLWVSGNRPTSLLERVPKDISVSGMQFEDPVYVDMLSGYVHDMKDVEKEVKDGSVCFKALPVWDSPVLVIERSVIKMKTK